MKGPIVFDFDKTLTDRDTLIGFYKIVNENNLLFKIKKTILIFFSVLYKIKIIGNDHLKKVGVALFLVGVQKSIIEDKSREYAKNIKLNNIYYEHFLNTPRENRIIASASFEIYLKEIFPSDKIYGSQLSYENGKIKGLEKNMFGREKMEKLLESGITKINTVYTDSYSDLPIMEMAEKVFLIKNNRIKKIKI